MPPYHGIKCYVLFGDLEVLRSLDMIGVGFPHKVGLVFWETRLTQWKIFYFDVEGEHGAV